MKLTELPPCLVTPPRMYIPQSISDPWLANYLRNKHKLLTGISGRPEALQIDISATDFDTLLKDVISLSGPDGGVRVYFGSFKKNGTAECDNAVGNNEHLLTLIFAPTTKSGNIQVDTGNYFVINSNSKVVQVSKPTASTWVTHFTEAGGKWEQLSQQLGKPDTKCTLYNSSNLQELRDEIKCLNDHGIPIFGITIYFGAYEDKRLLTYFDEGGVRRTYDIGNQLSLFFSIIHEDTTDISFAAFEGFNDYDTGTPCPPDTNCVGSSL